MEDLLLMCILGKNLSIGIWSDRAI